MKLRDIFLTASGNMFRSKLRTFLTILAIFIGAFTLTLTTGLGSGISNYIDQQVNSLGAKDVLLISAATDSGFGGGDTPKPYDDTKKFAPSSGREPSTVVLTNADVAKIKAIPGIKSVAPSKTVAPEYISGKSSQKYQISVSQYIPGTNLDLAAGKSFDYNANRNEVVIPLSYVSSLGFGSNDAALGQVVKIGIRDGFGTLHEASARVVGVLQKSLAGGSSITVNQKLLDDLYALQTQGLPSASTNNYQMVTARFDASLSPAAVLSLKNRLKDKGYTATTIQDQIGTFKTVISAIIVVLDVFAIIALLAASFGIINTLLMSVQERTKEIGLMKALGMSGPRIFLLFSFEALLLGFWGSAIGVALAEIVGHIANHIVSTGFLKDLTGLRLLTFTPSSILSIMALVMGIAFLAGTLPAYRASRQNPIDSLRYE